VGVFHTGALRGFETSQANKQLNRLQVIVNVFLILGVVVLLLSFVFINFIIKKELNETRKQIGIFKSFGYKISELS
jgi:ABC-type antimicrobial peptide transport system permease subunit